MCGVTGIVAFTDKGKSFLPQAEVAVKALRQRGPDASGIYNDKLISFGHARLKIIDTSENAAQPFTDISGRYTIVFNGEIYNFKQHRKFYNSKGIKFKSQSDTEVLLQLYIHEKEKCLEKLEGDFAFAIYDKSDQSVFLARDRFGVKPLLYYADRDKFIFASEMKALLAYDIPREMDFASVFTYLQLNYIPAPHSIFKNILKLEAGNYLWVKTPNASVQISKYYHLSLTSGQSPVTSYTEASTKLTGLLEQSVQRRLIADVPLGCFLSGGIDSSVITALAAKHTPHLNTFSIGYRDEPFFDETHYASLVAKKFNTNHTVFSLTNNDLFENLDSVLEYIDEPFADSSAIAVNILSRHTKKYVTVALSGDGADEVFSGYNKHSAEFLARNSGAREKLVTMLKPLWSILPKSRNSKLGNLSRQLHRFAEGMDMSEAERYWQWASCSAPRTAQKLLEANIDSAVFYERKKNILSFINSDFNSVLLTDVNLVLQNDMLVKTDMMSMRHGLEIRVPFLDYQVVDFAFSLPANSKIDRKMRKKILQDAFRNLLPTELYNRPKHGFEVPLFKWFQTEMKSTIQQYLLNEKWLREQHIFNPAAINAIVSQLFSNNPGDTPATTWNLLVFQHWWKKYME